MNLRDIIKQSINEWDPINLFPSAPLNEYDSEIRDIVELIKNTKDEKEIASAIHSVFLNSFSKDIFYRDVEMCRVVAKKILDMIKDEENGHPWQ